MLRLTRSWSFLAFILALLVGTAGYAGAAAPNFGAVIHVANLAALRNQGISYGTTVVRDGFAAPGDAPPLTYTWAAICPGTPDNLALYVSPNAGGSGCWSAFGDPQVGNVLEWGADRFGGSDSAAAFNAIESAANNIYIKRLIPCGTYLMSSAEWLINSSDDYQGMGSVCVAIKGTTTTQNTVYIAPNMLPHISDIGIDHTTASAPTAGAGLFSDDLASPTIERVSVQNNFVGVRLGATAYATARKLISQNNYSHGIVVTDTAAYPHIQWQLFEVTSQMNNGWGIQWYLNSTTGADTGGDFENVGTYANTLGGWQFGGVATAELNDMTCRHCYSSTDGSDGFQFVQVGANNMFSDTFSELAGTGASGRNLSTAAASHVGTGVLFVGGASSPSGQNREVSFSNLVVSNNSYAGVEVYSNSTLQSLTITNLTATGNGEYANPAGLFLINTTTVSNITNMHARDLGSSTQAYGVSFGGVTAANSNTYIGNAQLSGSTAGCAATLTNKSLVSGTGC